MRLANFDPDAFLRVSWQKHPLLVSNAWADWHNPLTPDELAGLACESAVESRLVRRAGGRADGRLICEHGPFAEERLARLGTRRWTLLVEAVDHHVPAVAALVDPFGFIPDWRIDDVMVSYAVAGGGVGPHFDSYDVFLVQGAGRRRWRIGGPCDSAAALLPHDDLRLLADFVPEAEFVLGPGDMLYLPPGVAHDGVALDNDCMTYSVGFRAPARARLIGDWADHLAGCLSPDDRYADPGLRAQDNRGEIAPAAIAALHRMVTGPLSDGAAFARWFGEHVTAPGYPDADWRPDTPVDEAAIARRAGAMLYRNPASRFSFIRQEAGTILLFVDGECLECGDAGAVFAERLCAGPAMMLEPPVLASAAVRAMIARLHNRGSVSFDPP